MVDEDDLSPDGSDQTPEDAGDRVDEGSITVDFFGDLPDNLTQAFEFTGGSPANGPNGEAITYTPSGDGPSLTARIDHINNFPWSINTPDTHSGEVTQRTTRVEWGKREGGQGDA